MKVISVAIDGPSGAGKSTIARAAAAELGFTYVDTGAMYRTLGLAAHERGTDMDDGDALSRLLDEIGMKIEYIDGVQHVFMGNRDVSDDIRRPEISMAASKVSAHAQVRKALVAFQQELARRQSVVMDGRDICMHVLPDAAVKIYLTASVDDRARRRVEQLREMGSEVPFDEVKADIEKRDYDDMHREVSPLCQAPDAHLIDTTGYTLEQGMNAVISYIKEKAHVL